jgi:tape measure domain-containing protein
MGALTTAYVDVMPAMGRFGPALKLQLRKIDVTSSGRDAGARFSEGFGDRSKKALKRGLVGAGVTAGAAFGAALTKGFGRLSAIENAEAKLTGLGHSGKTVDKIMVNALASVKGTAFGLDEAATLAATAVASGIKPGKELQGTLKLVADAATIGGSSLADMGAIFSQVAASNKVQGDTINQLNERGIPILKLLGDVMGKSQGAVSELASEGKIDFATFQKAMEKGLGGAALDSGKTATGAFKNMGAAFSRVGAALLKGVFPQMAGGFGTITKFLDTITPAAARFGVAVGGAFEAVTGTVKLFIGTLTGKGADVDMPWMNTVIDVATGVQGVFRAVTGTVKLFIGTLTGKGADVDMPWMNTVIDAAVTVRGAFQAVTDYVRSNVLPALKSLGTFVATVLLPAWLSWYGFLIRQLMPILKQVGGFIVGSVIPALGAVARFIATDVVPGFLSIVGAVKGLIRVVAPIIGELVGVILSKFKEMSPEIKSIWGSVKEIIVGAMFIIKEVVQAVTTIIRLIWDRWGERIKKTVGDAFGGIIKIIAGVLKVIAGAIKLFVALVKGDWSGAWNAIKQIFSGAWQAIRTILIGALRVLDAYTGGSVTRMRKAWSDLWTKVKDGTRAGMDWVHTKITTVLGKIRGAFQTAKDNISRVWSGVKAVVSAPIEWVKNNVYNRPLVPVWNRVAGLVGGPKLATYATGGIDPYGIRPGYTPGRDTHLIGVSGGEPILRPEAGRALGSGWVDGVNRSARTGGVGGVRRFLAEGGEGFQSGGIVGWIKNTIGGAGAAISGLAGKLKAWAVGGLRSAASSLLAPLRNVIKSQLSGSGVRDTVGRVANKALDLILDKIGKSDAAATATAGGVGGGGPVGAGGYARALAWARTQRGKPYRWAAAGPGGYDCSGFMSAIINYIRGRNPYSRLFSTGMAGGRTLAGLTRGKVSPFRIGVVRGNPGHTAGTLNGVNVESSGGVGVRVGGGARGWNNRLFTMNYGLARGGIAGDAPFDTLHPFGQRFDPAARALMEMLYGPRALAGGGVIRGGRGGVLAHIGEGRHDELVAPLPHNWKSSSGSARPLVIHLHQDGLVSMVQGIIDENDEFHASVGRRGR